MKCKIDITAPSDTPVWVARALFSAWAEPGDLECRHSQTVHDCYHPDWFNEKDGIRYFTPPAYSFFHTCDYSPSSPLYGSKQTGYIYGINGRHRVVLLFRHMDVIPMLLVKPDEWPGEVLTKFTTSKIHEEGFIDIPDLPISEPFGKKD